MNISFPNPPADPNKPKKKNKGCFVGCIVIAMLFLLCAVVGFFVLKTTVMNWFNKDVAESIREAVERLEQSEAESNTNAVENAGPEE